MPCFSGWYIKNWNCYSLCVMGGVVGWGTTVALKIYFHKPFTENYQKARNHISELISTISASVSCDSLWTKVLSQANYKSFQ